MNKIKYTKRDKTKILSYFYKKQDEYMKMSDDVFNLIKDLKYVHNGKKLSSTELLAYKKCIKMREQKKEENADTKEPDLVV